MSRYGLRRAAGPQPSRSGGLSSARGPATGRRRRGRRSAVGCGASLLVTIVCLGTASSAAETRFAQTNSRSQYVHWIDLYDANHHRIDPTDPKAPPYSPSRTCGRCHDTEAMARGHHFNALQESALPGRPGEPWIWTDTRTGTQLPLSYRKWPGTYDPRELGISQWDFVLKFGHQLPGGGPGVLSTGKASGSDAQAADTEAPSADGAENPAPPANKAEPDAAAPKPEATAVDAGTASAEPGRWRLSGQLDIDCLACHSNDHQYDMEVWAEQIANQNFAWAPTAAAAVGFVEGKVSSLPDDFDPTKADENARHKLPTTTYKASRVNLEKKVFFDIIRRPADNACYACHSQYYVGQDATPDWDCDDDVHLKAGLTCTDCHRNDLEHHTVRGFEGESHPSGQSVASLSCRGCHLDGPDAGRLGAPSPRHAGLPPLHLDRLSCTACHSGPTLKDKPAAILTSMAHGLGLPSHDYSDKLAPGLVEPVLQRDGGKLYPHRMMWPAFWGSLHEGRVTPLPPEAVQTALRSTLRVRRGQTLRDTLLDVKLTKDEKLAVLGAERGGVPESELTEDERTQLEQRKNQKAMDEFQTKFAKALEDLKKIVSQPGAEPIYVAGGKAYRAVADGKLEEFEHEAAAPYAWKLGHNVRPARQSLGSGGCFDCHEKGAPIFASTVTAISPVLDEQPRTFRMYESAGFDKFKLDVWNLSFLGRTAFKWFAFASMSVVGLVLMWYAMRGLTSLASVCRKT